MNNSNKFPYYTPAYPYTPAYNSQYTQQNQQQYSAAPRYEQQNTNPNISGFSWVDGINAAKAQNIAYGTSWLFFDVKDQVFYIKTVGYDGVPQPLYIASYKQISEDELTSTQTSAAPQADMSEYIKKSDLEVYATKSDIENLINAIKNNDYVTNEELDERIVKLMQERLTSTRSRKTSVKEEA